MKSLRIAELLQSPATDAEVVVKGWVRTKRGNKNVAFIALNDGSCVANMQVVVDLAKFDEELLRKVRSEERRVGKECLRLCRSRWSPYH